MNLLLILLVGGFIGMSMITVGVVVWFIMYRRTKSIIKRDYYGPQLTHEKQEPILATFKGPMAIRCKCCGHVMIIMSCTPYNGYIKTVLGCRCTPQERVEVMTIRRASTSVKVDKGTFTNMRGV